MKKFDDILRVLSSVLLGVVVKDFELIRGNLIKFLDPKGSQFSPTVCSYFAMIATVMLVLLLLRNLHGSARYDELIEKRGYPPHYERWLAGRFWAYFFAVAGLFGGPFFAGHRLANHLPPDYEVVKAAFPLFFPFVIYGIWDVVLWLSEPESKAIEQTDVSLGEVALKWIKIDALALALGTALLVYWVYLEGKNEKLLPWQMLGVFVLIACLVIVLDYSANRRFYFPEPPGSQLDDKGQHAETEQAQR
jgi:cytochrome bd-type quinol oxidase subunit 2